MLGDLGTTLSEEKCLIGFDQKSIPFICCRSVIALKTRIRYGPRNGDTKLSLALSVKTKQVFAYFLTTSLISDSKLFVDPSGRFIICDIQANSKSLTLANIYAPNEDIPAFFLDFFDYLSDFNCDDIVIGGDSNLVLDLEKDKRGGLFRTHQNSVKIVKEFCEKLVDVWRVLHPESSRYTWRKRHPSIHSRLDFS